MESQFNQARFVVPLLEDANSVQMALMQVMQLLATGQMEHKTAALMLYALQTASCNLRNTDFEVHRVTDVVIDRNTVNATCIGGSQWEEEDFDEEEDEEQDEVAEGEEVATDGAKTEKHLSIPEARKQVQQAVLDWVVETVKGEVGRPG